MCYVLRRGEIGGPRHQWTASHHSAILRVADDGVCNEGADVFLNHDVSREGGVWATVSATVSRRRLARRLCDSKRRFCAGRTTAGFGAGIPGPRDRIQRLLVAWVERAYVGADTLALADIEQLLGEPLHPSRVGTSVSVRALKLVVRKRPPRFSCSEPRQVAAIRCQPLELSG
jgi:hypothetical protein